MFNTDSSNLESSSPAPDTSENSSNGITFQNSDDPADILSPSSPPGYGHRDRAKAAEMKSPATAPKTVDPSERERDTRFGGNPEMVATNIMYEHAAAGLKSVREMVEGDDEGEDEAMDVFSRLKQRDYTARHGPPERFVIDLYTVVPAGCRIPLAPGRRVEIIATRLIDCPDKWENSLVIPVLTAHCHGVVRHSAPLAPSGGTHQVFQFLSMEWVNEEETLTLELNNAASPWWNITLGKSNFDLEKLLSSPTADKPRRPEWHAVAEYERSFEGIVQIGPAKVELTIAVVYSMAAPWFVPWEDRLRAMSAEFLEKSDLLTQIKRGLQDSKFYDQEEVEQITESFSARQRKLRFEGAQQAFNRTLANPQRLNEVLAAYDYEQENECGVLIRDGQEIFPPFFDFPPGRRPPKDVFESFADKCLPALQEDGQLPDHIKDFREVQAAAALFDLNGRF